MTTIARGHAADHIRVMGKTGLRCHSRGRPNDEVILENVNNYPRTLGYARILVRARFRVPPRLLLSHISAAARRLIGRAHRKQYTPINPNQNPIKIFTFTYLSYAALAVCTFARNLSPPKSARAYANNCFV